MIHPIVVILMLFTLVFLFRTIDIPLATYYKSFYFFKSQGLHFFTHLGLGMIYMIGFLISYLFFQYVKPNPKWAGRFLFLWLCAVIPSLICLILKVSLGRARPDLFFGEGLYGFYGLSTHSIFWSFPSGHTTTIMGVCFGLWALFPKYWWAFLTLGLTVALSRVLLIQHFLSDVVAASYLACVEIGVFVCLCKKYNFFKFLP